MKTVIAVIALLLLSTSVIAAENDNWMETCETWASLAEEIMKGRQNNTPMSAMMGAVDKNGGGDLMEGMVIDAYDSPRYSTEQHKARSIQDFKDSVYLRCAKSYMAKK